MKITDRIYAFPWQSMTANNCNTFLIDGSERILIDPGHLAHFSHVEQGLGDLGIGLNDIGLVICTHAHPDHIEAVQLFNKAHTRFAMHQNEWQLAKSMENMLRASGIDVSAFLPDFFLKNGELSIKEMRFEIYHTPGHSPGSICVYWPEQKALFTGDVIFNDGLGRTDLPGGDSRQLKESIEMISSLSVDLMFPGHMDVILDTDSVKANFERVKNVWFNYL